MCQVQLVLDNIPVQKARALQRALEPDNIGFPEGLSLEIRGRGDQLVFDFKSRDNIRQLIGTVDEVLEHIQVALKVTEHD